ncbi:hypothetical protein FRC03_010546 [Tulasnella sp. 419]|nr:hypothetical protein FRC02_003134 [Tulasnella sp. 418]KAG8967173.1 hypothetical protein FRC03_010546 [Tulasnella sp. 419]
MTTQRNTPVQGARGRPPPPPLRLKDSSFQGSSSRSLSHEFSPTTLLYELPPSASPRAATARTRSPPVHSHYHYPSSKPLRSPPPFSAHSISDDTEHNPLQHPRPTLPYALNLDSSLPSPSSPPIPGASRPRSMGFTGVVSTSKADLELFAQQCRAWFYDQDAAAGKAMNATLASQPPSERAKFTRLQASIRSEFHASQSLRRLHEFRALVAGTKPGQSLPPAMRSRPNSSPARQERLNRLSRFISSQCTSGAPGTHPFFEGLYAVLRLQALPPSLGGAGEKRIEWEIDDATFIESGGKEFMNEAIDIFKGVLGFHEVLITTNTRQSSVDVRTATFDRLVTDTDSLSDIEQSPETPYKPDVPLRVRRPAPPLPPPRKPSNAQAPTPSQSTQSFRSRSRSRASSDPFLDPAKSSPSAASQLSKLAGTLSEIDEVDGMESVNASTLNLPSSQPMGNFSVSVDGTINGSTHSSRSNLNVNSLPAPSPRDELPPSTPPRTLLDISIDPLSESEVDLLNIPQLRIWTFPPYISNPEINSMLGLFPTFITKKPVPRFTALSTKGKNKDMLKNLEEGGPTPRELRGELKKGTGTFWVGESCRDDGWRGGFWARFKEWFMTMFH